MTEGFVFVGIEQISFSLTLLTPLALVFLIPCLSADIAELISTPASHMVAALVFLNNKFAFLALPVMKVTLKKL
jgi:hypothetical protein